ncbi:hypothetical protein [Agromyces sp. NPDC058104]|uniref:hypothetical protein n=1 Tax=Agromyces sp. NPDC058104 TaxID=3346342 RepID=UPI0036DB1E2F
MVDVLPSEQVLAARSSQLLTVSAELDREIDSLTSRSNAMEQRATLLIGAASVVGALQVTSEFSITTTLNLALSFLAAIAGVWVVFPRRGDALDVRAARDEMLEMPPWQGLYVLVDEKIGFLDQDEKRLDKRGAIVRLGFIFLALSIAVTLIGALTPLANAHPGEPSPTPTTQRSES